MSMLRYALPALAVVGAATAADCSVSGTTTIQNSGDATKIAGCPTFTGSIAVATGTSGDISFDNSGGSDAIQRIKGDFIVSNAPNVTSVSGGGISMIDGDFVLDNVQTLSSVTFNQLAACGSIKLNALPNLGQLTMQTQIQDTTSLDIQNTFLSSLQGINLKECNSFYMANNRQLQMVELQLQNVSGAITFESNGNRLQVSLPNLKSAQNLTFNNVPSVSIPSLSRVNGSLGFNSNDGLRNISCPNLTRVDETLIIRKNNDIKSIAFPQLSYVGGALNVQDNKGLEQISFPKLQQVLGAFNAFGNMTRISMPALKNIKGAFNIQSSEDITNSCKPFDAEQGPDDVIKGEYACKGKQEDPNADPNSDSSSDGSSSRSGSGAFQIMPSVMNAGVLGVFAAMLAML